MQHNDRHLLHAYITGFVFSVALTLLAYFLVVQNTMSRATLIGAVLALGIVQLLVQLVFFLHLDKEPRPRWNLTSFLFAVLVVVIIGFGSIWIMNNLHYNMSHHGKDIDDYIIQDEGIHKP